MGYSCKSYEKDNSKLQIYYRLISSRIFFLKNILQVVMFQNVLMDPKILKEKQIFLYFSMSFGIFVSFQFHTNVNVLFHLNMLRLFQEIKKKNLWD